MKRAFRAWYFLVGLPTALFGQQPETVRLSGFVRSAASNEIIRSAIIDVDSALVRTESNRDGYYVLRVRPGPHRLRVRAIGFLALDTAITVSENLRIDFVLEKSPFVLGDVEVGGGDDEPRSVDPSSAETGISRLNIEAIKKMPVVLGEIDPIRTLTLLPGVATISDFSTGFSVRGGSADQNLILLDESTIYSPAHVFGFFSVFNSDVIDDVTLYKGSIPPQYGGRLSSVLDIRQRAGNANEVQGQVSIGLLASRGMVEGPLPIANGSFLVAARRTYADVFLKLSSDPDLNQNVAYFYDLNIKGKIDVGKNGSLTGSGYLGRDRFAVEDRFGASWGNRAWALRWNQAFDQVFSKVSVTYSNYDYRLEFRISGPSFRWTSHIKTLDLKVDESIFLSNRHQLDFGLQTSFDDFQPGTVQPIGASPVLPTTLGRRKGIAPAFYLGHTAEIGSLNLSYGVRASGYLRRGPATIYRYQNDQPIVYDPTLGRYQRGIVVDSVSYGAGQTFEKFGGLEPRVAVTIPAGRHSSLKASFTSMRQYLHLISNTNSPTPLDVWDPVGPFSEPATANQVAVGFASVTPTKRYSYSVEGYYKGLRHVIDFIDGADLALNDHLETEVIPGTGRAYGLELYGEKHRGRLTGWVSYTLGRSERRIAGLTAADPGINDGQWYPSSYDKTHNLAVVGLYGLSRKWTLGTTFIFSSGMPATYPESRYFVDGYLIVEYGPRNANRLPAYHRLDLTLTKALGRGQLQFGIYNVYNRFNAQSISFRQSEDNVLRGEAVQLSIFGLVPSISYTRRF